MTTLPGLNAGLPGQYGIPGQNQPTSINPQTSNSQPATGSSSLVQDLEQVFTILAGAVASQGSQQGGANLTSEAQNPTVQAIASVLGNAIGQISGQSVNLLDFLQNGNGNGSGNGAGNVGGGGNVGNSNAGGGSYNPGNNYAGTTGSGYAGTTGSGYAGTTGSGYAGTTGSGYAGTTGSGYAGTTGSGYTGTTSTQHSSTVNSAGSTVAAGAASSALLSTSGNVSSKDLSEDDVFTMISTALAQNGDTSMNDLSGPDNIKYWDKSTADGKKNLDNFYAGIVTAHDQFFPNVPISSFARALVAEAGAESTLNPNAGNGGLLQVTPSTVVADYNAHGAPITDSNGKTVLSPGQAFDPTNPETNVLLWAWYNKNNLAEGGVAANNWGKGQTGTVDNTFGNLFADWLGGPGDKLGDGTDYYVNRIERFYNKIGGTSSDFNSLLNQPLNSNTVATK